MGEGGGRVQDPLNLIRAKYANQNVADPNANTNESDDVVKICMMVGAVGALHVYGADAVGALLVATVRQPRLALGVVPGVLQHEWRPGAEDEGPHGVDEG